MKRKILTSTAASLIALAVAGSALATTQGRNGRILYQQEVNGKSQLFTVRPRRNQPPATHARAERVGQRLLVARRQIDRLRAERRDHAGVMS